MNDCVSDKKDSQQSVPILFTILSNISRIAFSKNLTKYIQMVALHWEKYFQHIREKYNSIYKVQMPVVTPHVCRHTFCSNMAKSGMNPKMLYYGTFRYKCHNEYLYPCKISGCTGRLQEGNQCIVTKVMCGRMRVLSVNMWVPNFLPVVFQRQKSLWYRLEIHQRIYQNCWQKYAKICQDKAKIKKGKKAWKARK